MRQFSVNGDRGARFRGGATSVLLIGSLLLTGCAAGNNPQNPRVPLFNPEKTAVGVEYSGQEGGLPANEDRKDSCAMAGEPDFIAPAAPRKRVVPDNQMRYSPGDRFNIAVPGIEDFSGDYMINADGRVILPFAPEIMAVGLTNEQLSKNIEAAYVRAAVFNSTGARFLAVRPVQYAPVNVSVSGAVFQPGRVMINTIKDSDKTEKALTKFGDAPLDRFIPSGLRAAGGVRPDADISRVTLVRGGKRYMLDWRGAFTGEPVDDVPLIEGDKIVVPEGPCFQSGLIRPSQITPPGIRVFMSNLTVTALNNASAAIGQYSGSVPYGTRFLQGLVSANCVGGTTPTNAARHAVLISRNPKTMRTEVIQRSIEELVRSANRDAVNPHLMPDDAIACYDSTVTEFRDIVTTLQQVVITGQAGRLLIGQ